MTGLILLLFFILSFLIYILIIRPKHLRLGASTDEVNLILPGDDMVNKQDFSATRITGLAGQITEILYFLSLD